METGKNKKWGMNIFVWRIFILVMLAILVLVSFFISISQGAVNIPFREIMRMFSSGASVDQQIMMNIRLPRTILTALVGMNLAVSGAILQAVMRNPLADPHIIGISSGAGIAGIFIMIVLPQYSFLITPAAFIGAMAAAICIYILAWKNGIKPLRIILAGVAVASFIGAGISALLILYSDRVHGALMWMVGGFAARSWIHVQLILPYTIVGIIAALMFTRHLNVLQLGDEIAKGLGMNVEVIRILLTAIAALLAASAVAVAGLLGFVGLIIPHTARLIIGSDYRFLLPASILLGSIVVILSDTVARCAFAPLELPVGIFMAALGAPFFLFLLRRQL
ncbi:FecCD family ABC transporter permease [Pectinatus sottacetonis]|uniref:FecCD family ABC transporter permease n=1 Tax=Pectinatus sottacetonis TaxID=1002795 RepID=UPI0018C81111|nr:iron ABC transporter permease [Pectinatus sottacetonis]